MDLGGGGGRTPPFSGIRPLTDTKGPPFELFSDIQCWLTDPKTFLKAPLAPQYILILRGERTPKKQKFWPNFGGAESLVWPTKELFSALGELGKPIWST